MATDEEPAGRPPAEEPSVRETLSKKMKEDADQRAALAGEEVNAIMKKHRCVMAAKPTIDEEGHIGVSVKIIGV